MYHAVMAGAEGGDEDRGQGVVNKVELQFDETRARELVAESESLAAAVPGVYPILGALGHGALVTEEGLAKIFGCCRRSIRRAVCRGELPPPVRLMGKPTWTAGAIVRHFDRRLADAEEQAKIMAKHRP